MDNFLEDLLGELPEIIAGIPGDRKPEKDLLRGEIQVVTAMISELIEAERIRPLEDVNSLTVFEGIDGTGKTQTAVEYAQRQHANGRKTVFLTMSHNSSNRATKFIEQNYEGPEKELLLEIMAKQYAAVHNFVMHHQKEISDTEQLSASVAGIKVMNDIIRELIAMGYAVVADKWLISNFLGVISLFKDVNGEPKDSPERLEAEYGRILEGICSGGSTIPLGRIFCLNASNEITVGRRHSRAIPGDRVKSPSRFERRRLDYLLISRLLAKRYPDHFYRVIANGPTDTILLQVARRITS